MANFAQVWNSINSNLKIRIVQAELNAKIDKKSPIFFSKDFKIFAAHCGLKRQFLNEKIFDVYDVQKKYLKF